MKSFEEMTPEELLEAAKALKQEKETALKAKEDIEKASKAEISKLKGKVKEAQEASQTAIIVTHDDEKYEVIQPSFRLPYSVSKGQNTSYKAEELKDNPEVIAVLVQIGSSVLRKVEKKS